jgi:hypothetical protein
MPLKGAPAEIWTEAAQTCQPEDIVDIADQMGLEVPLSPTILAGVNAVVTERLAKGSVAPQLADAYFDQVSRYSS